MRYQLSIVLFAIFILNIWTAVRAQDLNQEIRVSIYQSKVTDVPTSSGFFNTNSLGVEYQHNLIKNINGVIGTKFLQIIETTGNSNDPALKMLDRFSRSFLSLNFGASLIPIVIKDNFEVRFSPRFSIRHRNAVTTTASFVFEDLPTLVLNEYQRRWDIGGIFSLSFAYTVKNRWFLELGGEFNTYDKGDSVLDVGLSIGRKF